MALKNLRKGRIAATEEQTIEMLKEAFNEAKQISNEVNTMSEIITDDNINSFVQRFGITPAQAFEILIAQNAMYRPGPIDEIDNYIIGRKGNPVYICTDPRYIAVVESTYGVIVYQEQVMNICVQCAGFSLAEADNIRKFMSKKKEKPILEYREYFVNGNTEKNIKGCVAMGINADIANAIYDKMVSFAAYAFNRSHALAYTETAFYTAWLKANYPTQFFCANMNWADDMKELRVILADAKNHGTKILAPSINCSSANATIQNGAIRFGLSNVKSLGSSSEEIIRERENNGLYRDPLDFILRTNTRANVLNSLIFAGAFDEICPFGRGALYPSVDKDINSPFDDIREKVKEYKDGLKEVEKEKILLDILKTSTSLEEWLRLGKEAVGTYTGFKVKNLPAESKFEAKIEKHEAEAYKALEEAKEMYSNLLVFDDEDNSLILNEYEAIGCFVSRHPLDGVIVPTDISMAEEGKAELVGVVTAYEKKVAKTSKKPYAEFTLEDLNDSISCKVFAKGLENFGDKLYNGAIIRAKGYIREDDDGMLFQINEVENFEIKRESTKVYSLKVPNIIVWNEMRKEVKASCLDETGFPLIIITEDEGIAREESFLVSNQIKKFGAF